MVLFTQLILFHVESVHYFRKYGQTNHVYSVLMNLRNLDHLERVRYLLHYPDANDYSNYFKNHHCHHINLKFVSYISFNEVQMCLFSHLRQNYVISFSFNLNYNI